MRGDADDLDVDAEIARNLWKHQRMVPPGSKLRQRWDVLMLAFVLYDCVIIPVQLGWTTDGSPFIVENAGWTYSMDSLIYLLCALDILVSFRTTFYDQDHQINLDVKLVAQRYRKGWCVCPATPDLRSAHPEAPTHIPEHLGPQWPRGNARTPPLVSK